MSTTTKCTPLVKDTHPTHLTLATLHRELIFHALEQKTHLGGGRHGYLALLLSPAAYLAIANVAFIKPQHPGPNPVHILGATTAQITESNRAHAAALVQYNAYHTVEQQLKTMVLEAIPATFVQLSVVPNSVHPCREGGPLFKGPSMAAGMQPPPRGQQSLDCWSSSGS
jgi:hypothetical protein